MIVFQTIFNAGLHCWPPIFSFLYFLFDFFIPLILNLSILSYSTCHSIVRGRSVISVKRYMTLCISFILKNVPKYSTYFSTVLGSDPFSILAWCSGHLGGLIPNIDCCWKLTNIFLLSLRICLFTRYPVVLTLILKDVKISSI